jgi:nucleotide-binding universal stress UspA family protein
MLETLLVPYDGSPFSERALSFAVPIAQQHGASLVLTMANPLPPRVTDMTGEPIADPSADPDVRTQLRAQLERVAKRVATRYRVTTATQFREGPIVEEISKAADSVKADLVVIATHGRGGLSRLWLGSVTDQLLRQPPAPMLVTRGSRSWTLTAASEPVFPRILVALDGSPLSEQALEAAIEIAGDRECELVLVRVEDAPIASVSSTWVTETVRLLNQDYLAPLAAHYRKPTRRITTQAIVHTDPARAILELAKREHAFLIALATHGRSGARRAVLGSVADKVIRGSTLPVLVSPPTGGVVDVAR